MCTKNHKYTMTVEAKKTKESQVTAKCQKLHDVLGCHHKPYGDSGHSPVSDVPYVECSECYLGHPQST